MAKRKMLVPREHKYMVSAIKSLPDLSIFLWTDPQKSALENRKEYWSLIGRRIDYFQLKMCGYNPPDPLDDRKLHPGWKEFIEISSAYDFATLNLMIDQFEVIKAAAVEDGRNFSFANARELFSQRCRELANGEVLEEIGSSSVNTGGSITKQRDGLTKFKIFLAGNLPTDEEDQLLADLSTHQEWCIYWLFPVWKAVVDSTPSKTLKRYWEDYLDTFKAVLKLFKKGIEVPDEAKLLRAKWSAGHLYDPKTGRPLIYQSLYIS